MLLPSFVQANEAPVGSLVAVSFTELPSQTVADAGSGVIVAVGTGFTTIVADPETFSFLQFPSSFTDLTVYVYSPAVVGTPASTVYAVDFLFFVFVVPVGSVSSQNTLNLGSPVIVNVTGDEKFS